LGLVLQSFGLPPLEEVIPVAIILILSLSFHEAAHAWTADRLGDPTARMLGRLTLNPLAHIDWIGTVLFPLIGMLNPNLPVIGWAKPVPVNMRNLRAPRRDFAMVALAGPVSNLLIAIVAALIVNTTMSGYSTTSAILIRVVSMNVLLAVFNMIPVPPLDGGNVLAGFVPETVARVIDQVRPYGFLVLYALLLTGVLSDFVVPIGRAILSVLLPI
jgi:Zn-dependent protease